MSETIGIVTFQTFPLLRDQGVETEGTLKRLLVVFDRILYVPLGWPDEDMVRENGVAVRIAAHCVADAERSRQLIKDRRFDESFLLLGNYFENARLIYTAMQDSNADTSLYRAVYMYVQTKLDSLKGLPEHELKERQSAIIVEAEIVFRDLAALETLRQLVPGSTGLIGETHRDILKGSVNPPAGPIDVLTTIENLQDLEIPRFEDLSWADILDLRTDSSIRAFRQRLADICSDVSICKDLSVVKKRIIDDIWGQIRDFRPDLLRSSVSAVLGNVPIPGIGAVLSALELTHAFKLRKTYGWLYFLEKARARERQKVSTKRKPWWKPW